MKKEYTKIKLGPKESFGVIPVRRVDGRYEVLILHSINGHWSFPKGKQDSGETGMESARREFSEETGIKDVELKEYPVFKEFYQVPTKAGLMPKIVKYFLGFVDPDAKVTVQKEEIQNFIWVVLDKAEDQITHKESKEMFKKIRRYLKNHKEA